MDDLRNWVIGGLATILTTLFGWSRHKRVKESVPVWRRLLRLGSANARLISVEDALQFTTREMQRMERQRDRAISERDQAESENLKLRSEIDRLRSPRIVE